MGRMVLSVLVLMFLFSEICSLPPVPGKDYPEWYGHDFTLFESSIYSASQREDLPLDILVLRVEFTDVTFDLTADYPDSLSHDRAYFERLMFHVASYFRDVSHGYYNISEENFTVWEEVFTVNNPMGYYGDDENWTERIAEFVVEVVELADPLIDFTEFDEIMIIHAGAGQEADVSGNNEDELWSTFITRRSLQAGLDPENDEYAGIETQDGIILTNFVICPETEWQPDNNIDDTVYGIYGVYCHQFGHAIGLPTLFDNNSSNGASFGIGNFGLMGTGVWNANGFVPPLPCAWSRYYLGWEDDLLIEAEQDIEDLQLVFSLADDHDNPKMIQVKISDQEYFLLENRQQNPDGSIFNGEPSFTFTLLPPGEQDVYPPGHPNAGQPKFNFMENTYEGCEWDFYLPGLGGPDTPVVDGSGLLIWHIDENVIAANFDPDFESNSVNGDATHKGVDLEEADGIQHLDINTNIYSLGSPYDAFREGNNTYFGKMYPEGENDPHLPTSNSYYGGNQLEIYDISASDSLMLLSVRFEWNLSTGYEGENPYPAAAVDLDLDGYTEIFYPMPDGNFYLWDNFELMPGYPVSSDSLAGFYAFDEFTGTFIIPTRAPGNAYAGLVFLNIEEVNEYFPPFFLNEWAGPPVVNPDHESNSRLLLPLNSTEQFSSRIQIFDPDYMLFTPIEFDDLKIVSNLMLKNGTTYHIGLNADAVYKLVETNLETGEFQVFTLDIFVPETVVKSNFLVDIDSDDQDEIILVTTSPDTLIYVLNSDLSVRENFPVEPGAGSLSLPSFGDVDGNGAIDILIGRENDFIIIDNNGQISKPSKTISSPDSLNQAAGILAVDLEGDGILEFTGNMSRNRLATWDNLLNNDFEMRRDYPLAFASRSRHYPVFSESDSLFISSDNGMIFRVKLNTSPVLTPWYCEYGNLKRTASWLGDLPENNYLQEGIFVEDETYIYPNPLNSIFNSSIFNGFEWTQSTTIRIMTAENTDVEIKVFDIAGNIIYKKRLYCEAYVRNGIQLDARNLASGMYFAIIKAEGKVLERKFAIEK